MSNDEIIAVVQAHKEGKQIEWRELGFQAEHMWMNAGEQPTWDFRHWEYRVKPEPRKPREW